jgi:hypothetical protein
MSWAMARKTPWKNLSSVEVNSTPPPTSSTNNNTNIMTEGTEGSSSNGGLVQEGTAKDNTVKKKHYLLGLPTAREVSKAI